MHSLTIEQVMPYLNYFHTTELYQRLITVTIILVMLNPYAASLLKMETNIYQDYFANMVEEKEENHSSTEESEKIYYCEFPIPPEESGRQIHATPALEYKKRLICPSIQDPPGPPPELV